MLKVIVVDDEQHCRDRISKLLGVYNKRLQLVGEFDNVQAALSGIEELSPDLVFLDVQLHEKTGFDLLRQLGTVDFEVVFVTAHDKYAIDAFKFSAIDYLLKPIGKEEFNSAITKFEAKASDKGLRDKIKMLFHNLESTKPQNKRIALPTTDGLTFMAVQDIVRCQADVNYTHVFNVNGQRLTVAKTLKSFEELLEPHSFLRVHNSHLINISYVSKYTKGKGGTVTMADNSEIEVSVRKKEAFLKAVMP